MPDFSSLKKNIAELRALSEQNKSDAKFFKRREGAADMYTIACGKIGISRIGDNEFNFEGVSKDLLWKAPSKVMSPCLEVAQTHPRAEYEEVRLVRVEDFLNELSEHQLQTAKFFEEVIAEANKQ